MSQDAVGFTPPVSELPTAPEPKVYSDRVGIIDADSIMYNLGWYFEAAGILPDVDFRDTPSCPPVVHAAVAEFLERLRTAMDVGFLHLHFTASSKVDGLFNEFVGRPMRPQFRTTLGNPYKASRKESPLPRGFHLTLRSLLQEQTGMARAYLHDQYEADDAVLLHKKLNPEFVLSSNDKDVYGQHEGFSWRYDKRKNWAETDKKFANFFTFFQAITGDPTDGFIGVRGIGTAKAHNFVNVDNTPTQNWEGVLAAFKSKGFGEEEALINMRFANMHQLELNSAGAPHVNLWKPEGRHLEPVW